MSMDSSETPFSLTFPQELLNAVTKTGIDSYTPTPNFPFSPQIGDDYNPNLSAWCLNTIVYAYAQYYNKALFDTYPTDIESPKHLYWHENLHFFGKKVSCGFMGKIKSLPSDPTNRILITLRGTEKITEWVENIDFGQTDVDFPNTDHSVKIHSGFWDAFNKKRHDGGPSLRDQINEAIPTYLKKDVPNELYITGHSLGAAVATLIDINSILSYPNLVIISYLFGSPRVGSRSLSGLIRDLSEDPKYNFTIWRLVNTEDVVTTVPAPVVGDLIYSQLYISSPDAPNKVGSVNFSDNLGKTEYNHSPLTYLYANQQLTPKNKGAKPVKRVDQKSGDDKKSP